MRTGRLTLATTSGPEFWVAQVDPLGVQIVRQGEDITLCVDWSRETEAGRRRGTMVLRLPAESAAGAVGGLIHHTAPEAARVRRGAAQ